MATKSLNLVVSEKQVKKVKGIPVSFFKEIKTVEDENSLNKLLDELKKKGVKHFEVKDEQNNTNTIFTRMLGGKNYAKKVCKISKK